MNNQEFINILNKSITKIINFIWNVYTKEYEEVIKDESFLENIQVYKQHIYNIIWSSSFRALYSNYISPSQNPDPVNNNLDIRNVTEGINFIIQHLKLKGIIMGHIASDTIRKIKLYDGQKIDFYIYLTDLMFSRAFYVLNKTDGVYPYNKDYVILCIKDNKIEYKRIPNNLTGHNLNINNIAEVRNENFYNNIYGSIIRTDNLKINLNLKKVIMNLIYYNDNIISKNIVEQILKNYETNVIPDEVYAIIKEYLHVNVKDIFTSIFYMEYSNNLDIIFDEKQLQSYLYNIFISIIFNKEYNCIKKYITNILNNQEHINDLIWMKYVLTNKKDSLSKTNFDKKLDTVYHSTSEECFLKIYYDSIKYNKFDYELFKIIYDSILRNSINDNILTYINFLIDNLLINICASNFEKIKSNNDDIAILKICFLYDKELNYKNLTLKIIYNSINTDNLFTRYFKDNLSEEIEIVSNLLIKTYMNKLYDTIISNYCDNYINDFIRMIDIQIFDKNFVIQKESNLVFNIIKHKKLIIKYDLYHKLYDDLIKNVDFEEIAKHPEIIDNITKILTNYKIIHQLIYSFMFKKFNNKGYNYQKQDF